MVANINLRQFDDYKNCSWIKSLISLSSDFFTDKKVFNERLWLQQKDKASMDKALNYLNEASSVDFKYSTFKQDSLTVDEIYDYYNRLSNAVEHLRSTSV